MNSFEQGSAQPKKKFDEMCFKDTLKAFDDFRNKQQKCMKYYSLIRRSMYILKVYSIHYTLR